MKKVVSLILVSLLAVWLAGCSGGFGLQDASEDGAGFGKLVVSLEEGVQIDNSEDGLISDPDNIDNVEVKGSFNGWSPVYQMNKQSDGTWILNFSDLPSDVTVEPEDEYGFQYSSSADGVTDEWMIVGNMTVEEGQTKFVFKPQEHASLEYYEVSENAEVQVGGKTAGLGEEITLASGTHDVVVLDDVYGVQLKDISVKADETNTVEVKENLVKATGEVTFEFDPSAYPITVNDTEITVDFNPDEDTVEVRGATGNGIPSTAEMTDEDGDGVYTATVEVTAGQGYKFVINGSDWITPNDAEEYVDDLGGPAGVINFSRVVN